mgnify:CR=1 FL=1
MELDGVNTDIVCLPNQNEHILPDVAQPDEPVGNSPSQCFIAGWGALTSGGPLSDVLRSADVKIISGDYCNDKTSYWFDEEVEFCAGHMEGGKDRLGCPIFKRGSYYMYVSQIYDGLPLVSKSF